MLYAIICQVPVEENLFWDLNSSSTIKNWWLAIQKLTKYRY
jgi:hypothetical protein